MFTYIPALSLLGTLLIIALVVLWKFDGEQLAKVFEAENILLFLVVVIFCILLVVHLFKEQSWTADVLKIVAGVLVGVAAHSSSSKRDESKATEGTAQTAIGNANQQAGRDIIGQMQGDIGQLKDSVVNQFSTIQQRLTSLEETKTHSSIPFINRTVRFQVESDQNFIEELKAIHREGGDWTRKWMDKCISNPEFQARIDGELASFDEQGWRAVEMNLDNTHNGLHINFQLKKPYQKGK